MENFQLFNYNQWFLTNPKLIERRRSANFPIFFFWLLFRKPVGSLGINKGGFLVCGFFCDGWFSGGWFWLLDCFVCD
jgi:hypothetical protein